jgi:N-acetylglucosaminyldiphosphoundecaprenol N-acetyl-beta-D-mannosaminyltransferase
MKEALIFPLLKNISPVGYSEMLSICTNRIEAKKQTSVFTPNSEMLYSAARSRSIQDLLLSADILLPDGVGVYMAMKGLGTVPSERTAGIEFAELLMKRASKHGYRVFLLCAKPGIAQQAAEKLRFKFRGLNICGHHHGYFKKSGNENAKVIEMINRSNADILFVCLGFPDQEKWIAKNLSKLKSVTLAIGLGGSLDVWSGAVRRSPSSIRRIGLEWLWRSLSDPKRLPRIKNLVGFSFFTLKELLFNPQKQYKCYEIDNFLK